MPSNSRYISFSFRCTKCPAAKTLGVGKNYPGWDDSLLQAYAIREFGDSRGKVHGDANQKRDEAQKLLKSLIRGLSVEDSW